MIADERGPLRVLIVEDDMDIRTALAEALIHAHCDVQTVTNGHDALSAVQAYPPDVVLLDMWLPLLTGEQFLTLIRWFRDQQMSPKIIVMTADHLLAQQMINNPDPRVSAVLPKPYDLDDLYRAVGVNPPSGL